MDVTFTNVLEGARQYFQGLPTATSSTAGPTYPTSTDGLLRNDPDQNSELPPSSAGYWPQEAARPPTRERPPSEQRLNSHYQANYQEQFQFSRPHSREAPSNVQYQQHVPYPQSPRAPSRQEQMVTPPVSSQQSYHQMQNSQAASQNYYQQQQQRSYYPPAKPQMPATNNAYKVASTQPHSQNSQENAYYKHLYSPHYAENKLEQANTSQQGYRTTHNLPPIASLNLISYHSNKPNRDVVRTMNTKTRTAPTNSNMQQRMTYSTEMQQPDYRNNTQYSQQNRVQMQNYQYCTTTATQNYNQVITTTSNSNYSAQSSSQYYQTNKQPQAPHQQHPQVSQQNHIPPVSQQQTNHLPPVSQQATIQQQRGAVMKQKRESPLDLSVKTVRTPADSTLDDEEARSKYYNRTSVASHNYPTYDVYANSFQRNLASRSSAQVPKVEFQPNFNVYRREKTAYDKNGTYPSRYPTVSVPTAAHVNSYIQTNSKELPRVDFPGHGHKTSAHYPVQTHDAQKKRPADTAPSSIVPNKMSKVDTWRQSIDQQIEQRLSSYKQQQAKQANNKLVNGNYPNQERSKEMYNASYQQNRQQYQTVQHYPNNQYQMQQNNHNQTFVPSAGAHQYPGYTAYPSQQHQYQQQTQQLTRTNSNSSLPTGKNTPGGADKRVLSLLRNSLEIKGAKEAQKKLEQEQRSFETLHKHSRLDVQHPSTDVTAPLQPKPGFVNRHNVSPFTPTNLPESNVTSVYKLHIPKAVDSVNFESESGKYLGPGSDNQVITSPNGDLDGLAAFLAAARFRTKAELKQVAQTPVKQENSPPKLSKERHSFPPRRRLFSRNEEDSGNVPPRDKTGLRSSSETSVFDFPDSDSEGEMPVLERQTLEDMRRDRRSSTKQVAEVKSPRSLSPGDDLFTQACDSFVEQLKCGSGKKRGRRKKIEPDVLAKLQSVTKEKPLDATIKKEEEKKEADDDDSDVPLINCKNKETTEVTKPPTEDVETGKEETEKKKEVAAKDLASFVPRPAKKPSFGDGSHFGPGWEEEVYKYKKSLRMPPSLIQVTRPPSYHRLSTSLPDLDPCPHSPTPSSVADAAEDAKKSTKIKSEHIDSDTESNHSFNLFGNKNNYDSEGSCSIKSLPNTRECSSILDTLLERYGGRKKRKHKKKDDVHPKVLPKPEKVVELLPTPGYEVENKNPAVVAPGFRKKTIESFKEVFLSKSKARKHKQRVSIKEVFGEDRPASAPPVTCVDHIKIKEEPDDSPIKKEDDSSQDRTEYTDTRQALKNKLLNRGRKENNLLKSLVDKKIKTELLDDEDDEDSKGDADSKSETPSIDGDEGSQSGRKQKNKFRNIRRKFSSGFDYIRKKKKHVKREENEAAIKPKRRGLINNKGNPGSVQDIQKEIKGWVLNKGIGETILHRSARLGYTDIAAYCLEKMECSPSPKDNAGYTPLHEASTKGHLGIAKMLLMYGANVSESARGGIRPLHEAVENGYVEIVRLLLSYGADPVLATYSGMTPLALASDDATVKLLQSHIDDVEGKPGSPWQFAGPASCFDLKETGFDVLADEPDSDPVSEEEDLEFEVSDQILPNLYTLRGEPSNDRWILLQDLSSMLKIKSRDALLRQICPSTSSTATINYKSVLRELKMSDFLEQAHCCQFLNSGEKINTRASKIALVKYTDKVRELLNVEKVTISVR